jgi:tetratricopeptide (TPR) repeat protein
MLGAARRRGQIAVPVAGFHNLLAEVAAGNPDIVFQNLGLKIAPRWHYGVVVAYDIEVDTVELNSGEHERMVMPTRLFRRTWARGQDWAIAVLPPDRLPVTAKAWDVAQAAAALERVDAHAAGIAYQAAAKRWPDMWIFPFGLGNARYAQGDLAGALRAYRQAEKLDPSVPEVQNNLAELRRQMG